MTAKKSRPAGESGAAKDHAGDEITASLHAMRRCILIVGYALLVLLLAATLLVIT